MNEFIDVIDTKYFDFDIQYHLSWLGFGVQIGSNSKRGEQTL